MFGYFAAKRKNTRWACSSPAWAGDVFFDAISARNIFSTSRDADSQAFAISGQALTLHAPVVGRRLCRCRMPAEFVPRLVSPPMPHAAPSGYPLPRRRLETRAIDRRMGMDRLACQLDVSLPCLSMGNNGRAGIVMVCAPMSNVSRDTFVCRSSLCFPERNFFKLATLRSLALTAAEVVAKRPRPDSG